MITQTNTQYTSDNVSKTSIRNQIKEYKLILERKNKGLFQLSEKDIEIIKAKISVLEGLLNS